MSASIKRNETGIFFILIRTEIFLTPSVRHPTNACFPFFVLWTVIHRCRVRKILNLHILRNIGSLTLKNAGGPKYLPHCPSWMSGNVLQFIDNNCLVHHSHRNIMKYPSRTSFAYLCPTTIIIPASTLWLLHTLLITFFALTVPSSFRSLSHPIITKFYFPTSFRLHYAIFLGIDFRILYWPGTIIMKCFSSFLSLVFGSSLTFHHHQINLPPPTSFRKLRPSS